MLIITLTLTPALILTIVLTRTLTLTLTCCVIKNIRRFRLQAQGLRRGVNHVANEVDVLTWPSFPGFAAVIPRVLAHVVPALQQSEMGVLGRLQPGLR